MTDGNQTERDRSQRATSVLDDREAEARQADSLELPEERVHLWIADHRVGPDELEASSALLDAAERDRASRFRFPKDFRRFVFGHARVRSILARYSGGRAGALTIARRCAICGLDDHGKPYLLLPSGAPSRIRFSYSYSDQLFVVAVANGAEIGVDVERVVPDFAWREVAETALSSGERSLLDARSAKHRLGDAPRSDEAAARAFFGIWTRKEAVSKVSGRGLDQLSEMDTCGWTYGGESGEFEVRESSPDRSYVGKVLELPGHEAAVAVEGAFAPEWSVKESPADPRTPDEGA
jgi:4'-phosphopantetheinyl transferase